MTELVYHINPDTLTILHGPMQLDAPYLRKLAGCGQPWKLDLSEFAIVPQIVEPLGPGQRHGAPVVSADAVTIPAINKDAAELAADAAALVSALELEIEEYLNSRAREKGCIDITSLCTYANDPDPVYRQEGLDGVRFRSLVWKHSEAVAAEVMAGTRGIPTVEELLAELPPLEWTSARQPVKKSIFSWLGF